MTKKFSSKNQSNKYQKSNNKLPQIFRLIKISWAFPKILFFESGILSWKIL